MGAACNVAEKHRGGGAGDAFHVVVLCHPKSMVPEGFNMTRQFKAVPE
jgi:hypothetical protein